MNSAIFSWIQAYWIGLFILAMVAKEKPPLTLVGDVNGRIAIMVVGESGKKSHNIWKILGLGKYIYLLTLPR